MLKQYRFWLIGAFACLLGNGTAVLAATADVVSIGSISGNPGDTVNIPVSYTKGSVASLSFSISYNSTQLAYTLGSEVAGDSAFATFNVTPALPAAGMIKVALFSIKAVPPPIPSGTMVIFPFTISTSAAAGVLPLTVTVIQALDSQGNDITTTVTGTSGSVTVKGGGTGAPAVTLAPTTLDFGNQTVGVASAPKTVTLTNTGTGVLNIASIVPSDWYTRMTGGANDCGQTVAANGGSCVISVTLTPDAGSNPGTLTITDNAAGSPHVVTLSGTGVVPVTTPTVTVNGQPMPSSGLSFSQNATSQTVTLTNTGAAPFAIPTAFISVTGSGFALTGNTCVVGATLAAGGGSCSFTIQFNPTADSTGTLTIGKTAYPLHGAGAPAPVATEAAPTMSDFAMMIMALSVMAMGGLFGFARKQS